MSPSELLEFARQIEQGYVTLWHGDPDEDDEPCHPLTDSDTRMLIDSLRIAARVRAEQIEMESLLG